MSTITSEEISKASCLLRGNRVVWMKNGTMPVSALVLDFLPTGSVRIRTQRGTQAVDRTVKASSLRFAS